MAADFRAELGLTLDRAAGRRYPLGQQVVDELRRRVQAGSLGPGERLPPVRGLATTLGVTPETVAGAYKRLVEEGLADEEAGRVVPWDLKEFLKRAHEQLNRSK